MFLVYSNKGIDFIDECVGYYFKIAFVGGIMHTVMYKNA